MSDNQTLTVRVPLKCEKVTRRPAPDSTPPTCFNHIR